MTFWRFLDRNIGEVVIIVGLVGMFGSFAAISCNTPPQCPPTSVTP